MKRSISYPQLTVSPRGEIFSNGLELAHVNGNTSSRGPLVTFKNGDKYRQASVQTLVYECYVKNAKRGAGERIKMIDGNDFNCSAANMRKAEKNEPRDYYEKELTGWNGGDEIYC